MTKVLTDKVLIEKFLTRGVEKLYPTTEAVREKLMSGKRLRVYQGFDPTGPFLHMGHAMGIRALRILQQLGHEVIFLVGDFTAMVGDPDKDSGRKLLSNETIEANMAGWKNQAAQIIDFEGENPVQFKRNHEWLSKLQLKDLIELMSHATVQQMVERDMFAKRLSANDPIGLQEFIYPLMQGFDGVAMDVDMEIGGNDQTFNMLMGRQLVKTYLNKEKFVRTNKIMNAPDGRIMSKTKGNGINLGDTAENMFGRAMSYPDTEIIPGLEMLTDVPEQQIAEISQQLKAGANPMEFKKLMAFEVVKIIKGENEAQRAKTHFEKTVQNKELSDQDYKQVEIEPNKTELITLLQNPVVLGTSQSGSEIRRVIEQGGVQINGEVIKDPKQFVDVKKDTVIKFGKRSFFKVV